MLAMCSVPAAAVNVQCEAGGAVPPPAVRAGGVAAGVSAEPLQLSRTPPVVAAPWRGEAWCDAVELAGGARGRDM